MTKNASILILEDEETSLAVLKEAVSKEGYKTFAFQRIDSACVSTLVTEKIDLILTDLGLFGFDAAQMIKFMRDQKVAASIPIIIISGKPTDEIEKAAGTIKAKAWIQKPFKIEDVLKKVKTVLG